MTHSDKQPSSAGAQTSPSPTLDLAQLDDDQKALVGLGYTEACTDFKKHVTAVRDVLEDRGAARSTLGALALAMAPFDVETFVPDVVTPSEEIPARKQYEFGMYSGKVHAMRTFVELISNGVENEVGATEHSPHIVGALQVLQDTAMEALGLETEDLEDADV